MEIRILRLGHRLPRDERITTHIALVARAFGAQSMIYCGQHDEGLESSVKRLVEGWGGSFGLIYEKSHRRAIKEHKEAGFTIIHLTMYGIPLPEALPELGTGDRKLLVIVGSEQVPAEIYGLSDFNVSVTSQPHSEVAALAMILDRLQQGEELDRGFDSRFKGKRRIEPSERGKKVSKA